MPRPAVYATSSSAPWGRGAAGRGDGQDPAEDHADARRPADREDRPETERRQPAAAGPTSRPPSRSPNRAPVAAPPAPARRRERHRARRARDRAGGAGLERPPRPIEDAGCGARPPRFRPEDDEEHAADLAEDRQVVEQRARRIGRGDAEDREDRAEPDDVRERMPDREPARGGPSARPTTATADSWPMYAGTSGSTHGERKLRRPAPSSATAIVRSAGHPARAPARTRRAAAASWPADDDELDSPLAELDHRDALEVAADAARGRRRCCARPRPATGSPRAARSASDELDRRPAPRRTGGSRGARTG